MPNNFKGVVELIFAKTQGPKPLIPPTLVSQKSIIL